MELRNEQHYRGGDDRPRHEPEEPVDPVPELRAHPREPLGLLSEGGRVRFTSDPRGPEPSGPGSDEAPGQDLGAHFLGERIRFSRQQRLVELQTLGGNHGAVHHDLIPGVELEDVIPHDVADRDLLNLARADHPGSRGGEYGQPIQGPFGPELLVDPDRGVRDQHDPEQRVRGRSDHEDDDEQRPEERVERREDV